MSNDENNGEEEYCWEESKENVQPLRQGRRIEALNSALATPSRNGSLSTVPSTPSTAEKSSILRRQREAFEKQLRLEHEDPLHIWIKYIEWVDQNYPLGDGNIERLLSKAVQKFQDDSAYKNDIRFIKICIRVALKNTDVPSIFLFYNSKAIGKNCAYFYIEWCKYFATQGNWDKAIKICKTGFDVGAEPLEDLIKTIQFLNERKTSVGNDDEESTTESRRAFGELKTVGKKHHATIDRTTDRAAGTYSVHNSTKKTNAAVRIDENGEVEKTPVVPWNSMPKRSDMKENEQQMLKIGGQRVKQKVCKSLTMTDAPRNVDFEVFHDDIPQTVEKPPQSNPPTLNIPVLTEKKKKTLEVASSDVTKPERPEDAKGIIVDWDVLYGGMEEMSFEEYRYLRQENRVKSRIKSLFQSDGRKISVNYELLYDGCFERCIEEWRLEFYRKSGKDRRQDILQSLTSADSVDWDKTDLSGSTLKNSKTSSSLSNSVRNSSGQDSLGILGSDALSSLIPKTPQKDNFKLDSYGDLKRRSVQTPNTFQARKLMSCAVNQSYSVFLDDTNFIEKDEVSSDLNIIPSNNQKRTQKPPDFEIFNDTNSNQYSKKPFVSNTDEMDDSLAAPCLKVDDFEIFMDSHIECSKEEKHEKIPNFAVPSKIKDFDIFVDSPTPSKPANKEILKTNNYADAIQDDKENAGLVVKNDSDTSNNSRDQRANTKTARIDSKYLSPIQEVSTEVSTISTHSSASSASSASSVSLNESSHYHSLSITSDGLNHSLMNIQNDSIYLRTNNPFDDRFEERLIERYGKKNLLRYVNYHQMNAMLPLIRVKSTTNVGGENWRILQKLGEGAFSSVYAVEDEEGNDNFVFKVQKDRLNVWEFYVLNECQKKIESCLILPSIKNAIIEIKDGFFYENGSLFICNRFKYGSLVDFVNATDNRTDNMILILMIAIDLLIIIDRLHSFNLIHADLKADNVLIRDIPSLQAEALHDPSAMYKSETKCIALIDLGRMIDMNLFKEGTTFTAKTTTDMCIEMRTNKPWKFQTDYFGVAGILYLLHFGKYMEVHQKNGMWYPNENVKRYVNGSKMWKDLFHDLLNVPSCDRLQSIPRHIGNLLSILKQECAYAKKVTKYESDRKELLAKLLKH
ncbi:DgyrCDS11602 [Dimorphilus gyrociliatus]|uniref:DgyrCDS11602 n=1 Tax=Dimorphilus gyrociliatus TaxID=2664684 RepID=A0A7I8W859_9ANNE|nr:DgyrCDS11602 [Dimorphilus gyrociliatus]